MYRCPSAPPERDPLGSHLSSYVAIAGVGEGDALRPGVWSFDRFITFPEMTDMGTMFLFLETSAGNGPWPAAGKPTLRALDENAPYFGSDGQFAGFHGGVGTIAAFVDGSVRGLTRTLTPACFKTWPRSAQQGADQGMRRAHVPIRARSVFSSQAGSPPPGPCPHRRQTPAEDATWRLFPCRTRHGRHNARPITAARRLRPCPDR